MCHARPQTLTLPNIYFSVVKEQSLHEISHSQQRQRTLKNTQQTRTSVCKKTHARARARTHTHGDIWNVYIEWPRSTATVTPTNYAGVHLLGMCAPLITQSTRSKPSVWHAGCVCPAAVYITNMQKEKKKVAACVRCKERSAPPTLVVA